MGSPVIMSSMPSYNTTWGDHPDKISFDILFDFITNRPSEVGAGMQTPSLFVEWLNSKYLNNLLNDPVHEPLQLAS